MARNEHSGYPLKWFKDQNAARHAYECAICLEVLKDPVQVRDCGHQFCTLCIDNIMKTDPRCPSCRIELSDAMIFEDHAARRLIKQLDVNCCNEGCNWVGSLSSLLQGHQKSCNFFIRLDDNANQLDVGKLAQKLEILSQRFSTLEKKHETDIKELKLKHDEEVGSLRQEILLRTMTMGIAHAPHAVQEPETAYTWKIANFTRKLAQANSYDEWGVYESGDIESEPFFSSYGYKMELEVTLDEGASGYTGYMGVYLRLLKGTRDGSLPWPFTKRYTFVLVDQQDDPSQRQNIEAEIVPEGEEAFKRPRKRENESSWGRNDFVKHSTLRTRQYIRDHTVYIKLLIEP